MDSWPQDQQRHKRTFDEMSQHASLSPSPFFFGHPMPSMPLDNSASFFERRRTSHPHNLASQSTSHFQDNMAEPRVLQRPSLEHRASQTIIDLTDDVGEPTIGNTNTRFMSRSQPQLGRNDSLAFEDIIDLTRDVVDDEVEIINTRRVAGAQQNPQSHNRPRHLPHPHPRPRLRLVREDSPSVLFPEHLPHPMHHHHDHTVPPDVIRGNALGRLVGLAGPVNYGQPWNPEDRISVIVLGNGAQRMPDHLDYVGQPFARARQQPKPQHQPPLPAKSGFTRSPKEDDVAICPGCMKELVAEKGSDEPVAVKRPGSKTPSKKDREEHHFWVIKECGHVYCNKCYKGRKSDKKEPSNFSKKIAASGKTIPICAVDGCNQDVGEKRHWVGVFI